MLFQEKALKVTLLANARCIRAFVCAASQLAKFPSTLETFFASCLPRSIFFHSATSSDRKICYNVQLVIA